MCGIAGAVATGTTAPTLRAIVERAVARQAHRGPDDSGIWCGEGVVLGHNRLSIIDLSGGHQPMHDEGGRFTIVFNGEIYNFRDIRRSLELRGHRFVSSSDTEVLLHLYIEEREGCLFHLNGMFSFAVWDHEEKTLFLARDRLGVKPLYYWPMSTEFRFASELNALAEPSEQLDIDEDAVIDYLTGLYVPAPRTIYSNVKKLPAAHWLKWKAGSVTIQRYWNPWQIQPNFQPSENEWIERLRELFVDAVRVRLVSDVPLGAFLSGGIDSSAVVTTMAALMQEPVKTFTIGFEGDPASELPYARAVSEYCGSDQVERIVAAPDVPFLLETICQHFGEPFADSSAIPTFLVSKLARERVTVALSGDGGDELFAGYDSYRYYQRLKAVEKRLGRSAAIIGLASRIVPHRLARRTRLGSKARTFLGKLGRPLSEQWAESRSVLSRGSAPMALGSNLRKRFADRNWRSHLDSYFPEVGRLDTVDQLTRVDMQTYLAEELLTKVDRMSMANSLEVRSPFLDYRLVELALSIPAHFKLRGGQGKWILQKMLEGRVPQQILWRRKQGFTMPLGNWFKGNLNQYAREVLLSPGACAGLLDARGMETVLREHQSGQAEHSSFLWALIVLQSWLDRRNFRKA